MKTQPKRSAVWCELDFLSLGQMPQRNSIRGKGLFLDYSFERFSLSLERAGQSRTVPTVVAGSRQGERKPVANRLSPCFPSVPPGSEV